MYLNEPAEELDPQALSFLQAICGQYAQQNRISPGWYERFGVKRGLRNADGTGVMAGITQIGNVRGYYVQDGEKVPMEGQLIYRGIDVRDLIHGFMSEGRFGFEETAYLLLFGRLPTREQLSCFRALLDHFRTLPARFTEDMILKAPSPDVMNKLARSTLALYSYDAPPRTRPWRTSCSRPSSSSPGSRSSWPTPSPASGTTTTTSPSTSTAPRRG